MPAPRSHEADAPWVIVIATFFLLLPFVLVLGVRRHVARSLPPAAATDAACVTHVTESGDTLESIAARYFGDEAYAGSILLATNTQSRLGLYPFIERPFALAAKTPLCVPNADEADVLRQRYERYLRAGHEAMLLEARGSSAELDTLEPGRVVTLVAWLRSEKVERFRDAKASPAETWVTVGTRIRDFCRAYLREHEPGPEALALRLEQRLGLAPGSSNAAFVEIEVTVPKTPGPQTLFRPCASPSTRSPSCSPPPTLKDFRGELAEWRNGTAGASAEGVEMRYWYLRNYFGAYGDPRPYQYPWTGAGHTFDWAPSPDDPRRFVGRGESEYVVAKDTPLKVVSITATHSYCAP